MTIKTFLRPIASAIDPQKYAPAIIPETTKKKIASYHQIIAYNVVAWDISCIDVLVVLKIDVFSKFIHFLISNQAALIEETLSDLQPAGQFYR